jgi:hypothetical protein
MNDDSMDDLERVFIEFSDALGISFDAIFDQFQEFMRQQNQHPYISKEAKHTKHKHPGKPRVYFQKFERPRTRSNL